MPKKLFRVGKSFIQVLFLRQKMGNITTKIRPLILPKDFLQIVKVSMPFEFFQQRNKTRHQRPCVLANKFYFLRLIRPFCKPYDTNAIMVYAPRPPNKIPEFTW